MNNFQILEFVGIAIIVVLQLFIFVRTKTRITVFKSIFPDADNFEIVKPGFSADQFKMHPKELLSDWERYTNESAPAIIQAEIVHEDGFVLMETKYEEDNRTFVDLINKKSGGNAVTDKLLFALNIYLIRNRGVASDFYLIKDVVERNTDAVEHDINQSISLPLYLGLLGTFLGIIAGLFQIAGANLASDSVALDSGISMLLNGVKIAMIASFTGLGLTVLNSGYFFKGAKVLMEDKKNDFYTFIQVDLLPLLNQNINSTLFSLQNNLHKFNEEFKGNISKLGTVVGTNHEALIAQQAVLTTLDNIDIAEFAKANVKVLKELQISTQKFSEFNAYLGDVGELVNNTKQFTFKLAEMIERTSDFHALGQSLVSIFSENKELVKFLQNHYDSLDTSHQLITHAVNNVAETLDESLVSLKTFTQERITEIQHITLREIDLMQNEYPEKWKNLDNLNLLASLDNNLQDIKISSASQIGSMANEMKLLGNKLSSVILELEAIKTVANNTLTNRVFRSLVRLFNRKRQVT